MKAQIETAFPQCLTNHCLVVPTAKEFDIAEDDKAKKCYIVKNSTEAGILKITNPLLKDIYFLVIDKCLFFDSDAFKKCDCAVFDNRVFCFVEIKDCSFKNRQSHKSKAVEQLKTTIELFKANLDFQGYQLEALMCFRFKKIYPAQLTTQINRAIEFQDKLQTTLLEGNQKVFNG
jgi:hypothetical protein